ncbi:MAG: GNAT family N-acetyltransferase [Paludibacter sp.]|nr:GNAT family N-acetyltransferase [Paludibacter sp.]
MQSYITFEFCNWNNPTHTTAFLELLNHYMLDPMGDHEPLSIEKQLELIDGLKNHPTAEVLLMKKNDYYAGMTTIFTNYSTFNIKPYLYIHDVVVLDTFRGQGLGKHLIKHLTDVAKERGCCKLSLEVREDNPGAQKVYRELGFKECEPKMFYWEKKI